MERTRGKGSPGSGQDFYKDIRDLRAMRGSLQREKGRGSKRGTRTGRGRRDNRRGRGRGRGSWRGRGRGIRTGSRRRDNRRGRGRGRSGRERGDGEGEGVKRAKGWEESPQAEMEERRPRSDNITSADPGTWP